MHEPPTLVTDNNDVSLLRVLGTATRPCLLLYSGPDAGQRFDLEPGPQIIGRVPEAAVRLDAPGISRRHAELLVGAGTVLLSDLGSANGTWLNEAPVNAPVALKDGDLIRVSGIVLRFHSHNSLDLLLHDKVHRQAITDSGTGAYNRKFMTDMLRQAFARARQSGRPLSVICYDLDHFKQVNDTYGHAGGDTVLRTTTDIARAELRDGDLLARVGGEEFTLVLENTPLAGALELAERIRATMAEFPIELPDPLNKTRSRPVGHRQTVSMGIAELGPEMADEQALLQAADQALYAAKRRGRNQVCV
ncbi:GGDEF domain-containing protein [Pseudorhodoferax sp.]|uniref:GGDEF domain-containing protein n=1 Tax=Pseudorhodoferax sp. TaxID=1993553 RepID=UPI002DD63439|nr:GGDEF domain-containing protein [Pseudorhodoferax sp.]